MTIQEAQFEVNVAVEDCLNFARLSGDWNPLHTDAAYAAESVYGRQVLHGAFSAGLISRLAGMHLPGKDCLLYGMRLRFIAPILPPVSLLVRGKIVSQANEVGRVDVTISDSATGVVNVEASYDFGYHRIAPKHASTLNDDCTAPDQPVVLVTGATGGLGSAVIRRLGTRGLAVPRGSITGRFDKSSLSGELSRVENRKIAAIVHCAWPTPDNNRFIALENAERLIEHHIAGPLRDIQFLAALIAQHGQDGAPLILVGSTFAEPGRHYFRMPLYSIAKSTVPTVVEVLALELASTTRRCFGVVFDVLDGGMNKGISNAARQAHADRSPWGELATTDEAAEQIIWLLENQGKLLSGATITLSAGAIP